MDSTRLRILVGEDSLKTSLFREKSHIMKQNDLMTKFSGNPLDLLSFNDLEYS